MEEKRLVPQKRFKEFKKEWKERQFSDLGVFGITYSFSRAKEGTGKYHHIHYGDIHTRDYGVIDEDTNIPTISEYGKFELLKQGDIIIADASEDYKDLGKTTVIGNQVNRRIIAGLHTFKFTPNKYLSSNYYLYYSQTNLFKYFISKIGTGTSVLGISKQNLGNMKLYLPETEEQQKIGEFFNVLDERIANQERKIAKVKALKDAYLTEMFPQEGETVPKRRFKGFEGKWEKFKLEDLAEIKTGYAFSSNQFNINGKYLVVTNKNIQDQDKGIESLGDRIDIQDINIKNNYKLSNTNVLVTMDGVNIGETGKFSDENAVLAQRVGRLNSDQIDFIYQVTKVRKFSLEMHRIAVGNAIKHISLKQIAEYSYYAPTSKLEQQKIGQFLKNLDDQISAEETKLEKLKKMKEAYLEEMFV